MPRKTVLIYADGDFDLLAEARQTVAVAERHASAAQTAPSRFGDGTDWEAEVEAARTAYDAAVDAAAERAEEWVIESIGFEEWADLLAAHPPRKITTRASDDTSDDGAGGPVEVIDPADVEWGVNTTTFPKALLLYVDPEDPEHRTITKAGDLELSGLVRRLKRLSIGQVETLWVTAYMLNTGGISDPKAVRYSLSDPRSAAT